MLNRFQEQDYQFFPFGKVDYGFVHNQHFVLLRHDIDFSIEKALTMAEIEKDLGIQATYFFMVTNPFYNLLDKYQREIANAIVHELGHHLGLHFDLAAYPDTYSVHQLRFCCHREVELLQEWLAKAVTIVSYHRPNKLVLSGDKELSRPLPHTYADEFFHRVRYISDSRGEWRYSHPLDSQEFKEKKPLHLLVHPIWWNEHDLIPKKSLEMFVEGRSFQTHGNLKENCEVWR